MQDSDQEIIRGTTLDAIFDNLTTSNDELRRQIEEKDKTIKRLRKENIEIKKPKSKRLWVKVFKDTDISFLSFHDKGILLSLCQLVDKNKGNYLVDRQTGGIITTWAGLGKNIGLRDMTHAGETCRTLVDKGILIVEQIPEALKVKRFKLNPYYVDIGRER